MFDEEKITNQYRENEREFERIQSEVETSLRRVATTYYQKTKFRVYIPPPRLKGIDSVILKMKKRGLSSESLFRQNEDTLSLVVNDFLGARIICNTLDDVKDIEEILLLNRRFRQQVREPKRKRSGYRALHLDILYETHWKEDLIFVPVEIQIKTQLQHAWAEITHDESYKPENQRLTNELDFAYSRHMADILDNLDAMACTIRRQRLSLVTPPYRIDNTDTEINPKTLSFQVSKIKKGEKLTQQETSLLITRLADQGFKTIAEVVEVLEDKNIENNINDFKEGLHTDGPVSIFELIYYGSAIKRGKIDQFKEEISEDYGLRLCNIDQSYDTEL